MYFYYSTYRTFEKRVSLSRDIDSRLLLHYGKNFQIWLKIMGHFFYKKGDKIRESWREKVTQSIDTNASTRYNDCHRERRGELSSEILHEMVV